MTLTALHQQIGRLQRQATDIARALELSDRIADTCGHPQQGFHMELSVLLRCGLSSLFTRLHRLEARLPTPELLSARAYDRMIALGFQIDAAEAARTRTYREASTNQRRLYAA